MSSVSISAGNERTYVDNAMNRKFGRVGKPIPKRGMKQQEILENNTYEELLDTLRSLALENESRVHYEVALNQLHRSEVEESWMSSGIEPHTKLESVQGFTPGIITYEDLEIKGGIIGRGGFGEVYAASWRGTPVAFKQLIYQGMSKKRRESFLQEVKILAGLDHPNTLKFFGAVADESHLGIVMEYLPRTLFQAIFIDLSEFDETIKKRLITQITSALTYLHGNNIVHCDVKSENVLLDKEDNAKLSDFGLSAVKKATESSRSTLAVPPGQGTPRYSAPEVLRGELLNFEQLRQADVYSLAIVAFEVLAEEEPFEGLSVKQLEENVGRGDLRPEVPSRVSEAIQELMQRCLAGEASRRPSAAEFQEEWKASTLYDF
jgi:tRNA A-37 threonylcarbamoyl transferase component Bud32